MPRKDRRRKTRILALCAMLSTLGVVILALSALLEVAELVVAMAASLLIAFAVLELRGGYPWMIYLTTAVLSWILMPFNSGVYCYIFMFGHYPMLKLLLDRKLPRVVAWILKFLIFNVIFAAYMFLLPLLLTNEIYTELWYILAMTVGGNLILFLYDRLLNRFPALYFLRLRDRLRIGRWLK